jgi:hypothetical protein
MRNATHHYRLVKRLEHVAGEDEDDDLRCRPTESPSVSIEEIPARCVEMRSGSRREFLLRCDPTIMELAELASALRRKWGGRGEPQLFRDGVMLTVTRSTRPSAADGEGEM